MYEGVLILEGSRPMETGITIGMYQPLRLNSLERLDVIGVKHVLCLIHMHNLVYI